MLCDHLNVYENDACYSTEVLRIILGHAANDVKFHYALIKACAM